MAHDGLEYKRHRSFDWPNGGGPYLSLLRVNFTELNLTHAIAELFHRS